MTLFVLGSLLFLPPLLFYLTNADSHSTGLSLACVIIVAILSLRVRPRTPWLPLATLVGAIAIHETIAAMLRPIVFDRAALSLGLLVLVLSTATLLARWFFYQRDATIRITLEFLRYSMIAVAVMSLAGLQPSIARFVGQPVFPFTEPSHFALVFAPLLAHACFSYNGVRRYAWLAIGLALALALQSLSLVVVTILIAGICLPWWQLATGIMAALSMIELFDTKYYTDRLDFGAHTTNQSALVYLQGWELATDAFARTSGWGIGFQQLGLGTFNSPSADALFRLYRLEANLYDGGFVAAKMASEFGVFGLISIVFFTIFSARIAISLRRHIRLRSYIPDGTIFSLSIIVCYSIDMFVRGLGYFSASSTLLLAALIFHFDGLKGFYTNRR